MSERCAGILSLCITLCLFTLAQSIHTELLGTVHYDASSRDHSRTLRVKRQSYTDMINDQLNPESTTKPVVSVVSEDTTSYYDIEYISAEEGGADHWIDLVAGDPKVVKHSSLQQAYRLAVKIDIGFSFLFYGHSVKHATIATGGFLYMSEFLHSFLTASQYVAPLMANFDTSLGLNESEILFRTDDQAFIAQWNSVYLKDEPRLGKFTFQVQLHRADGKIVAAYKEVPVPIANISTAEHPVKIGLSDAYYWDVDRYRTIYPYHTYNASIEKVQANTAIVYTHKKTCNMLNSCDECLLRSPENFQCFWCSALDRCSDSYDRQRQDWITRGCVFNITQTHCDMMFSTTTTPKIEAPKLSKGSSQDPQTWKAVTAALCIIFAATAASVLAAVVYGYRHPQSKLGQFLVRNRPSELWSKFKSWKDKDEDNSGNMNQI